MKKKILCVILAAAIILFAACGKGGQTNEKEFILYANGLHDIKIEQTNYDFIVGGKSDYKIVIPENADSNELTAANELNFFYDLATGDKFSIITDRGLVYNAESKYIFIGNTAPAVQSLDVNYSELGENGYKILTAEKSIFIRGAASKGTINGVYCFLEYIFGFEYYAVDEYRVDSVTNMKLPKITIREKPDFAYREGNYGEVLRDSTLRMRMRFDTTADMYLFGHNCHNSFNVIPRYPGSDSRGIIADGYYQDHPDWYSKEGIQLCYSNQEMIAQYIENLKLFINNLGVNKVVLMGQQDNHNWCSCALCSASKATYGVDSAVMINFANRVSAEINEWLKTAYPNAEEMRFIVFAYYATNDAPALYNESKKAYEPVRGLRFNDNVGIMYAAPMDYHLTFQDEINLNYYDQLQKWSVLTDVIHYWAYPLYTWEYMVPFDMYSSMQPNYITLLNYNTSSIFDQTKFGQGRSPGFGRLHNYLESKLQWNVNLDIGQLTDDFFENYFKESGVHVRKYFDEMRAWYNSLYETTDVYGGWGFLIAQTKYWPKNLLEKWLSYTTDAKASIEHYKAFNLEMYNKIFDRIVLEELSIRYLLIQLYRNTYSSEVRTKMIDDFYYDFTRMPIQNVTEQADAPNSVPIKSLWESWGIK